MSAATITQAQDKGLRQQLAAAFATVRDFAAEMYIAHGGWINAVSNDKEFNRASLKSLARQAQAHSPSLADELRNFASRG
jgi:uncharacterized damage-inducible protein DinB